MYKRQRYVLATSTLSGLAETRDGIDVERRGLQQPEPGPNVFASYPTSTAQPDAPGDIFVSGTPEPYDGELREGDEEVGGEPSTEEVDDPEEDRGVQDPAEIDPDPLTEVDTTKDTIETATNTILANPKYAILGIVDVYEFPWRVTEKKGVLNIMRRPKECPVPLWP